MLGIEGYIILLIIALVIVVANLIVNRGRKSDRETDASTKEH
ncbi:MAG: hypothetical protein ABIR48_08155 [Gammaproteobacteria bacterium]